MLRLPQSDNNDVMVDSNQPVQVHVMDPTPAKSFSESYSSLIREIRQDAFLGEVVDSQAFKRLAGVSFLGAIDYAGDWKLPETCRTRFNHSLGVAALARYVSKERGYSSDTQRHLICAALLHDIGHPPLSHSAERVLKARFGMNHHDLAERLIDGHFGPGRSLRRTLGRYVDPERLKSLISGRSEEPGSDLFRHRINIDTIDGIIRAMHYDMAYIDTNLPLRMTRAVFLTQDESRFEEMDWFWQSKNDVYRFLVHSRLGLEADYASQSLFRRLELSEDDLVSDERHCKAGSLGSALRRVSAEMRARQPRAFCFVARDYFINSDLHSEERYGLAKRASVSSGNTSESTEGTRQWQWKAIPHKKDFRHSRSRN